MNFLYETLRLGLSNLLLHKLRSLLTALGIIFGVAAVITMVAIGEGNKQKALADIRQLGARNIIVRSVKPPDQPMQAGESSRRALSYGLKRIDLQRIDESVSHIQRIIPLKQIGSRATREALQVSVNAMGTTPQLTEVTSLRVARGRYLIQGDLDSQDNVAILGAAVAQRLFPLDDPLHNVVWIDQHPFKVVGVLHPVGLAGGAGSALVGRDLNFDIHLPLTTAVAWFGDAMFRQQAGSRESTSVELSELYIEVQDERYVRSVAEQVDLVLRYAHPGLSDVSSIVPLELLEQAERTLAMFNYLMAAIAAISLLVGGIGIMNIMLASVTERTREIGIRRALGATRHHIITQFLVETTVLSAAGGLIGVALGVGGVSFIKLTMIWFPTATQAIGAPSITEWSILLSFAVATTVGVVFGLYPAIQAARQDPIVALRHD